MEELRLRRRVLSTPCLPAGRPPEITTFFNGKIFYHKLENNLKRVKINRVGEAFLG
jgi:hypothetical protein